MPSALRMTSVIEFTFEGRTAAVATTPTIMMLAMIVGATNKSFAVFTFRIGFTWFVDTNYFTDVGVLSGVFGGINLSATSALHVRWLNGLFVASI